MLNFPDNSAGTKGGKIKEWKVLFLVQPAGICLTVEQALAKCEELGINPAFGIVPVPAAITETEMEVVYR